MKVVVFVALGLVAVSLSAFFTFRLGFEIGREELRPHLVQVTGERDEVARAALACGAERSELQVQFDTVVGVARECQGWLRESLDREAVCRGR